MIIYLKKYILILLFFLLAQGSVKAENWICLENKSQVKTYTNCQFENSITNDKNIKRAVKLLANPCSIDAYNVLLGNNPSKKVIKIKFKNLGKIDQKYLNYEALGWKENKQLHIYINKKYKKENIYALSALIAGRTVNIDTEDSINEEIYAMALEGATWGYYLKRYPNLSTINSKLIKRENSIYECYIASPIAVEYIRKIIISNNAYKDLNTSSEGYSNDDLNIKIKNLYDALYFSNK